MEINKELIDRVISYKATKQVWRSDSSSIEFKEANFLNKHLYGEELKPASKCECLEIFYFKFDNDLRKNVILEKMEKQFFIKAGKQIQSFHFQSPINIASSDEDCIKLLRLNKENIKHFDRFPDNWEEIVDGKASEEKPKRTRTKKAK